MIKIIYLLFFLIIISIADSVAQEEGIVPLSNNPVLINEWKKINSETVSAGSKIQSATNDTLLLPFIEDFSAQYMFPNPALWQDSDVFINTNFPRNPPTIGVATFDGLNMFGNPYVVALSNDGGCDTLTSKPLNTEDDGQGNTYDTAAGLFFSFFYEQKGWGERPESTDHLYLDFFNPVSGSWVASGWSVAGTPSAAADATFTRVQITINNPDYFHKGFRFRFRSWGSRTGNVDHWHVDYVTLKAPPNFSNINDVAYVTPGKSLLNNLTAMPYTHYKSGTTPPSSLMLNSTNYIMFNNNNSLDKICRFVDKIYDPLGVEIFCNGCPIGSNNQQVNHQSSYNYSFPFSTFEFPSIASMSTAAFDVVNHIESTSGGPLDDNAQNDTIHYLQKFYNYYAHDDGTCELGYNLNVSGASLAYKFHIYKADDLHAIQFYFTQIGASVANQLFNITVWNDAGGVPGTIKYQKMNQVPSYSNIIDGFVTYAVNPPQPFQPGDYYFGFIQVGNVGLELGYDANVDALAANKYYKTNGGWTQLVVPGSWMIRPVFSPYPFNVGVNEMPQVNILSVYPNPVSSVLHIDYNTEGKKFQYELMDASGRVIVSGLLSDNSIDVSKFMNGFYVLRVFDAEKKNIFQQKVIIHH